MTGVAQRFSVGRQSNHAHFIGKSLVRGLLAPEESELSLAPCCRRGNRIFHDAGNGGVGHDKPARTAALELVGKQSESIGVTLEMGDVIPKGPANHRLQCLARSFSEEGLYGFLATVAERRITQVVGQAGRRYNLPNLLKQRAAQFRSSLADQSLRHVVAQRHAHRCHLQRVSQSVVHEDAARQREYLCLVLQSAKGCREYQSVVVALEFRAVVVTLAVLRLLAQSFVRYELFPVHHGCKITAFLYKIRLFQQKMMDI